uniref:Uncharacterized protein n=1 Tax=Mycena chlorophos TaxID=658473 RepID=A0ABQ0L3L0_MYCCL|nr:predicted protein [Mycena chlorophos]
MVESLVGVVGAEESDGDPVFSKGPGPEPSTHTCTVCGTLTSPVLPTSQIYLFPDVIALPRPFRYMDVYERYTYDTLLSYLLP